MVQQSGDAGEVRITIDESRSGPSSETVDRSSTPPKRVFAATLIPWVLIAVAGQGACVQSGDLTWAAVNSTVHAKYPEVAHLTTSELSARMQSDSALAPILLDAREPDEYEVSHIHGAVLAPDLDRTLEALAGVGKDRAIIAYCSVGYRSGALAKELQERGYTNVYNLEGSIFQWANENRPLYRGENRVVEVHPYNRKWRVLLDRRFWPETSE
ncbi:MAG: rhodanese-like domain-containing protein [Candidatus Krumholzibacteriota bacterium]|nr:rhodanese-like domain-containing protein [Candidatus Krumholzibacteriota bacterium]